MYKFITLDIFELYKNINCYPFMFVILAFRSGICLRMKWQWTNDRNQPGLVQSTYGVLRMKQLEMKRCNRQRMSTVAAILNSPADTHLRLMITFCHIIIFPYVLQREIQRDMSLNHTVTIMEQTMMKWVWDERMAGITNKDTYKTQVNWSQTSSSKEQFWSLHSRKVLSNREVAHDSRSGEPYDS